MQPVSRPNALSQRDLLGIEGLSPDTVSAILDLSETYVALNRNAQKKSDVLRGRTLILTEAGRIALAKHGSTS